VVQEISWKPAPAPTPPAHKTTLPAQVEGTGELEHELSTSTKIWREGGREWGKRAN